MKWIIILPLLMWILFAFVYVALIAGIALIGFAIYDGWQEARHGAAEH